MQLFGTEICKNILPNIIPMNLTYYSIWIRLLDIERKNTDRIVIDDVRFDDDAKYIKEKNDVLIKY